MLCAPSPSGVRSKCVLLMQRLTQDIDSLHVLLSINYYNRVSGISYINTRGYQTPLPGSCTLFSLYSDTLPPYDSTTELIIPLPTISSIALFCLYATGCIR